MSQGRNLGETIKGALQGVGDVSEAFRANVNGFADSLGKGITQGDSSHGGPAQPRTVATDTTTTATQPGGTFGHGTADPSGVTNSTTAAGDVHPDAKKAGEQILEGADAVAAKPENHNRK